MAGKKRTSKMDGTALVSLVKGFLDPATTAGMLMIPSACVVYCIVQAIKWYASDEQEQQQNPIGKKLKKAIFVAVILFSLTAILRIFGINA